MLFGASAVVLHVVHPASISSKYLKMIPIASIDFGSSFKHSWPVSGGSWQKLIEAGNFDLPGTISCFHIPHAAIVA